LERNPVHGTGLLAPEPEPVEPVPEVVEVPEPVVEVPEPEPEPEPPVVRPAPPPRQVAIVLSSRQEAYEAVANELSERLDNVAIYDLQSSQSACGPPVHQWQWRRCRLSSARFSTTRITVS
jgi:hypothetical protein